MATRVHVLVPLDVSGLGDDDGLDVLGSVGVRRRRDGLGHDLSSGGAGGRHDDGRGSGSAGNNDRRLRADGRGRRAVARWVAGGSVITAEPELEVGIGRAELGLDVVRVDVGRLRSGGGTARADDGADGVVGRGGLRGAAIVAGFQVVSVAPAGAGSARAIDKGQVEVVACVAGGSVEVVLELGQVAGAARGQFGQLDGDAAAGGLLQVLVVEVARVEDEARGGRAAILLLDGPEVDGVVAAVGDLCHRQVGVAGRVEVVLVARDNVGGGDGRDERGGGDRAIHGGGVEETSTLR